MNMAQTPFYDATFIILIFSQHLKIYLNLDKPTETNTGTKEKTYLNMY